MVDDPGDIAPENETLTPEDARRNRTLFLLGWFGGLAFVVLVGANFARRAAAIRAANTEPETPTGPAEVPYRSWPRPERGPKKKVPTPTVPGVGRGFLVAEPLEQIPEPGSYVIVGDSDGGTIYADDSDDEVENSGHTG